MNIHELDAASNNSVDDIRSLVEQVRFAPQAGKYKVYIVDEVHMLSTSAFNAFLKTLEEPPGYAIFILATTEKHKILPTILSRCQIFDFKRITTDDTVAHLEEIVEKEAIKADKASLQVIARKSEGCMRDALSILDKIVSFTNGQVTYQNTIDNLNILDEDYYFRLLDSLMQQDLAEALLLYDEINKKGFEGDMVLNGFAEFIRNVLVCKDAKAVQLLDVVEGMQEKYAGVAKKVETAYLVSALNILNDAEINFKMARNKRLHVELTLIKLNFLQQAIEFSVTEGIVSKKKRVEGPVAYTIRPVPSIQLKPAVAATEAKLMIHRETGKPGNGERKTGGGEQPLKETGVRSSQSAVTAAETVLMDPAAAVISRLADSRRESITAKTTTLPSAGGRKKTLLEVLREKAGDKYNVIQVEEAEVLEMEKLHRCWEAYAVQLEQEEKHSSAATFRMAKIVIENDIKFNVTVSGLTSQRFIDMERLVITDYIQQQFHNRAITFSVLVEEGEPEEVPQYLVLNSRQRFEKIAEQYPLVRELKDRLKLELE
jgi:DNA polymerase-3 subunit gamma/tau